MRYEARFLLGRGAMGEVWVGLQRGPRGFERPVVLKRARPSVPLPEGLDAEEALVREAHLLSLIAHPNVVGVIDLTKTPEGLVLVLELVRGVSLRRWVSTLAVDGRAFGVGEAARLAADVARGLDAAQQAADVDGRAARIVHRDVNPENLMVGEHGLVKLLDFGVARTALRERTVVPMIKGKLPLPLARAGRGRRARLALGRLRARGGALRAPHHAAPLRRRRRHGRARRHRGGPHPRAARRALPRSCARSGTA
ncbi:MAG: protein kinase [Sandaracinaceae bacterium]|nr:protein kinase [Sandaracinaceae bacterium]